MLFSEAGKWLGKKERRPKKDLPSFE